MTTIPDFRPRSPATRNIAFVAFDGVSSLDLCGPLSIFTGASHFLEAEGCNGYECRIVSMGGGPVATDLGAQFLSHAVDAVRDWQIDTLVIPGAFSIDALTGDAGLVDWIAGQSGKVRRFCSVCTGAYLLAAAGLAAGRRLATHWAHCANLQERFPNVKVESDPIFVQDGSLWSSAGVTAGIDLALALVEADHGRALAMRVARQHVVYLRRSGAQSQLSVLLQAQAAGADRFSSLHEWLVTHLDDPHLTVDRLAAQVGMSPRNFARVYKAITRQTPGKAVEALRVELARRLLESTDLSISIIANRTGFCTEEKLRMAFHRHLKVSPRFYRENFGNLHSS